MTSRNINVVMLGFDNGLRLERAVSRFFSDTELEDISVNFYLFSLGYPIPTKETNYLELEMIAKSWKLNLCVMTNSGQDGNIIRAHELLGHKDHMIFYDADTRPDKKTWLSDALDVMDQDDKCGFVTINCSRTDNALCQQTEHLDVAGVKCAKLRWPGGWPLLMFSRHFPWQHFNKTFSYYGGTEGNILDALNKANMHGYMLREHDDLQDHQGLDADYLAWKHYAIVRPEALSLEEWLKLQHSA